MTQTLKLEYEVPSAPEFGGFTVDLGLTTSGRQIGFVDAENGPKDLYEQVLKAILFQSEGRYGSSVAEIQTYLQAHSSLIDITLPKVADNSSSRVPPYIEPAEPVKVDLSKGILIQKGTPPAGCSTMRLEDSRIFSCLGVSADGQLVFTEGNPFPVPDVLATSPVVHLLMLLEAMADVNRLDNYPQQRGSDYLTKLLAELSGIILRDESPIMTRLDARVFIYRDEDKQLWSIINFLQ